MIIIFCLIVSSVIAFISNWIYTNFLYICLQELARRLQEQEQELDSYDMLDRDRQLAIEAQDKELAKLLQERVSLATCVVYHVIYYLTLLWSTFMHVKILKF